MNVLTMCGLVQAAHQSPWALSKVRVTRQRLLPWSAKGVGKTMTVRSEDLGNSIGQSTVLSAP